MRRHRRCSVRFRRAPLAQAVALALLAGVSGIHIGQAQTLPGPLAYWDGSNLPAHDNGQVDGGNGTLTAATADRSWTDSTGLINRSWAPNGVAVFQGTAGTVTVDLAEAPVFFGGAQFRVGGYIVSGSDVSTDVADTVIAVGDGTPGGAAITATIGAAVNGLGGIRKTDLGTLLLTADNTYSGGTVIDAGTLQLGSGGPNGSIVGDVANNGILVFNRSDALSFDGVVSGNGALVQQGPGTLVLSGANTYTGPTSVNAGSLVVTGSLGATAVGVASGATLAGTGSLGGEVTVAAGGHLAPGVDVGTLTLGALSLGPGSVLDYDLGTPDVVGSQVNDLLTVNGNLTLDGTLNVDDAGGFGPGLYRLMDYGGVLVDNGLVLGTLPSGLSASDLQVLTGVPNQVNLLFVGQLAAAAVQLWDGANLTGDGVIAGGSGAWTSAVSNTNWTTATGTPNARWTSGNQAVFTGAAGTVAVDATAGAVNFSSAQFAVDGYSVTGGPLTTTTAATPLRVGDSTSAGAAMTATISSPIVGTGGLKKTDLGTLVLSAANTYSGITTVTAGTLQVASPASLGAATGITFDGTTAAPGRLLFSADATLAKRSSVIANGAGTLEAAPGTTLTLTAPAFTGNGGAVLINTNGTFNVLGDVAFVGNTATSAGGAVYSNGSLLLQAGARGTLISANTATGNGGAFWSATTRTTAITGSGGALDITGNTGSQGGAVYSGTISMDGAFSRISLSGNTSNYATATASATDRGRGGGGVLYAYEQILLRNTGPAAPLTIANNTSGADGGALLGHKGITIAGNFSDILFENNSNDLVTASRGMGGALRVTDGALVIDTVTSGSLTMRNNTAATFGGALDAAYNNSTMSILGSYGSISLTGNRAVREGGGAWGSGSDMLINTATQGAFELRNNSSRSSGGALLGYFSDMTISGTYGSILADGNFVTAITGTGASGGWGGAMFTERNLLLDPVVSGDFAFTNNRAASNGGALASGSSGSVTIGGGSGRLVFDSNAAGTNAATFGLGGAIYTPGALRISGNHAGMVFTNNTSTVRGGALYAGTAFNLGLAPGATLTATGNRAGIAGGFLFLQAGSAVFDIGTGAVANVGDAASLTNGTDGIASGAGVALLKQGSGTLALWGNNTYTGATQVQAGTLQVNGAITGPTTVSAAATLGGHGTASGAVAVLDGGHIAPGASAGTLTVGALNLAAGSFLDYELSTPGVIGGGVNDLINVTGALALDGTLNVFGAGSFGTGIYRLINYGGTFTDSGLAIGTVPAGFLSSDFVVQTVVPGQVNLLVQAGGFTNRFWDGSNTVANGAIDGGTGTWDNAASHWTGVDGALNSAWTPSGFAIFQGAQGTVTLGDNVVASGMQFLTDGYRVTSAGAFELRGAPVFAVRVDPSVTATVDATIADAGSASTFTKSDAGTLVLAGANTYSGGTQINAGTVRISGDGNLGAAGAGIGFDGGALETTASFTTARAVSLGANGGTFVTDAATQLTLASTVSGPGQLTKLGAGTLSLDVANTHAGGTNVSGGTLRVAADDRLGADTGPLRVDGATLQLAASFDLAPGRAVSLGAGGGTFDTQAFDMVVPQVMSGSGGLIKQGSGSLTLGGDNTYLGGTTVMDGTLQLGNGAESGSIVGNIANDGTVAFDHIDDVEYAGVISGTGSLIQQGAGTLILTAAHTFTGGTRITSGALQLGNGGATGSVAGDIVDDGDLIFARNVDAIHSGAISGSGTVHKRGANTLTFAGDGSYTGATSVEQGRLLVDGSLVSAVNVAPGAVLGGHGRVGSIVNDGEVAPGGSIGTLTVTGDFVQNAGGTLSIELDDRGNFDVLDVGGAAHLAGAVNYLLDQTSLFARDLVYTYLPTAAGVTGTFATPAERDLAGVTFTTRYLPAAVQVEIATKPLVENIDPIATENIIDCVRSLDHSRATATGERAVLLGTMVRQPSGEFVDSAISACPRDSSALPQVYHALTGSRMARLNDRIAQLHARSDQTGQGTDALFDAYRQREPGVGAWLQTAYVDGEADGMSRARPGYDWRGWDFTVGIDRAIGESGVLGGYVGRSDQDVRLDGADGNAGTNDMRGWAGGVYGSYWSPDHWFASAAVEYAGYDIDSRRNIAVADIQRVARGSRSARGQAVSAAIGYNWLLAANTLLQPTLAMRHDRLTDHAYTEADAGALNLSYDRYTSQTARAELGLSARHAFGNFAERLTVLYGYAFYVGDYARDDRNLTVSFDQGDPFEVRGNVPDRHGVRYGVGVSHTWHGNTAISFGADIEDYDEIKNVSGNLTLRTEF